MSQKIQSVTAKGSPTVPTSNSKWWRFLVVFGLPVVLWFVAPPAGLSLEAWRIFAIYVGAIFGVILKPLPEPVILLIAVSLVGILFHDAAKALSGFSNKTAWLVFSAFLIGQAFIDTSLGRRISYLLLKRFGKSALSIGYCEALSDLIVSPATPSNTARSGGIVYPIFRSLAETLGSKPGPTGKKIGAYLTALEYQNSMTTHAMFITAGASNAVLLAFASKILNVQVSWASWAIAALVPGLLVFFIMPWFVYKVYPPELKAIPESKDIAIQGLKEMGPMKREEKLLVLFFIMAIAAWIAGTVIKVDNTIVAVSFVACCLLFGVVKWESLASNKSAWSTFIWYAGILGLADLLAKAKFFEWFAGIMGKYIPLQGMNPIVVLALLFVICILPRYLFASTAAYAASFGPVLFSMALVSGVNPMAATLVICYALAYGSSVTPYSNAVGPILDGTGYVEDKAVWMKLGASLAIIGTVVFMLVGLPYWKVLGLW